MLTSFVRFDKGKKGYLEEDEAMMMLEHRRETKTFAEMRSAVRDIDLHAKRNLSFLEWSCGCFDKSWIALHTCKNVMITDEMREEMAFLGEGLEEAEAAAEAANKVAMRAKSMRLKKDVLAAVAEEGHAAAKEDESAAKATVAADVAKQHAVFSAAAAAAKVSSAQAGAWASARDAAVHAVVVPRNLLSPPPHVLAYASPSSPTPPPALSSQAARADDAAVKQKMAAFKALDKQSTLKHMTNEERIKFEASKRKKAKEEKKKAKKAKKKASKAKDAEAEAERKVMMIEGTCSTAQDLWATLPSSASSSPLSRPHYLSLPPPPSVQRCDLTPSTRRRRRRRKHLRKRRRRKSRKSARLPASGSRRRQRLSRAQPKEEERVCCRRRRACPSSWRPTHHDFFAPFH